MLYRLHALSLAAVLTVFASLARPEVGNAQSASTAPRKSINTQALIATWKSMGLVQAVVFGRPVRLPTGRFLVFSASPVKGAKRGAYTGPVKVMAWVAAPSVDGKTVGLSAPVVLPTPDIWAVVVDGYLTGVADEGPSVRDVKITDIDGDGRFESAVVIDYSNKPACGIGATEQRRYYVLNLEPSLSLAADLLTNTRPEAETVPLQQGTVLVRDVNGDGHNDLVLRLRTCELPSIEAAQRECGKPQETSYLWNAHNDTYHVTVANVAPPKRDVPCR